MSVGGKVIHSDPEILGGTPVFVGTRVPVQALLDYLKAGGSLDGFLDDFPSVTRDQAVTVLEEVLFIPIVRQPSLLQEYLRFQFEFNSPSTLFRLSI